MTISKKQNVDRLCQLEECGRMITAPKKNQKYHHKCAEIVQYRKTAEWDKKQREKNA